MTNHIAIEGVTLNGEQLVVELEVPSCLCRRCLLHDDPGGCLRAEEVA